MYYNSSFTISLSNQTNEDELKEKIQQIVHMVTLWYLPIIVCIGLIGNTLTLIILSCENKLTKAINPKDSFLTKFRSMRNRFEVDQENQPVALVGQHNNTNLSNFSGHSDARSYLLYQNKNKINRSKFTNHNFSSANYFIFALATSDLIYNFILSLVWISRANLYDVVNINYICQITICISYMCGFLSAVFTLLFTFQRFMAVVQPLKSATSFSLQSTHFIRRVIIFLIIFSIMVYSFSLVLYDTEPKKDYELSESVRACGVKEKFTSFVYIFDNTADTFLTLIIPLIGILIMNAAICKSFSKHLKSKNDLLKGEKINFKTTINNTSSIARNSEVNHQKIDSTKFSNSANGEQPQICKTNPKLILQRYRSNESFAHIPPQASRKSHAANSSRHVTKTLLLVSFAFILLNCPYRASKLISYIRMTSTDNYVYSNLEYAVNEVLINLYFTSYSVNFFLYSLCGKKFRCSFQALILFCFFSFYTKLTKLFRFVFRIKKK